MTPEGHDHLSTCLDAVVSNVFGRRSLYKYLQSEHCQHDLDFVVACRAYILQICSHKRSQDAAQITSLYLLPGSHCELNLGSSTTVQVLSQFETESASPSWDLFEPLRTIAEAHLLQNGFARYVESHAFHQLVATRKLVLPVDSPFYVPKRRTFISSGEAFEDAHKHPASPTGTPTTSPIASPPATPEPPRKSPRQPTTLKSLLRIPMKWCGKSAKESHTGKSSYGLSRKDSGESDICHVVPTAMPVATWNGVYASAYAPTKARLVSKV